MTIRRNKKSRSPRKTPRRLSSELLEERRLLAADMRAWEPLHEVPTAASAELSALVQPDEYQAISLDADALSAALADAPVEFSVEAQMHPIVISLPNPDGIPQRFNVWQSPIMAPELAAKFPEIRTYAGQGIDDPTATLRFDVSPAGVHAQVLAADSYFIDPIDELDDDSYVSYFSKDAVAPDGLMDFHGGIDPFSGGGECPVCGGAGCSSCSNEKSTDSNDSGPMELTIGEPVELRTFRLAVAATGEYTAAVGGTVSAAMSSIVTTMNRVNGIFERDVAVRMQLVGNNDQIIYANGATDPYFVTGLPMTSRVGDYAGQNQTNLDAVIGPSNYDIGHVFGAVAPGFSFSGVARIRSAGVNGIKARGASTSNSFSGDIWEVALVSHELGHHFGADHTWDGNSGSCTPPPITNPPTAPQHGGASAVEPGGGSTIMAYATNCGDDSFAAGWDPHFHSRSIADIQSHLDNVPTVGLFTDTGNTSPNVEAGLDYTIPVGTPFILTADAVDPDGDSLTYSWEQRDAGTSPGRDYSAAAPIDYGTGPLVRAGVPTTDNTRSFPTSQRFDTYPLVPRTMTFAATVRDNSAGGGGVTEDQMTITAVDTGAPFVVTSQPGPSNNPWTNREETITWNVAGTDANGIDADHVDIFVSVNAGPDIPLALNTPNDGSHIVELPGNINAQSDIIVQGSDHIFFNFTDGGFINTIGQSDPNDQLTEATSFLNLGDTIEASLVAGNVNDVDMYSFTASSGRQIGIDLDALGGGALDARVRLFDSSGNELATNDNGVGPDFEGNSLESYLEYTTPTNGASVVETYFVGVSFSQNTSYDPVNGTGDTTSGSAAAQGAYSLRVRSLGTEDNGRLASATSLSLNSTTFQSIDPSVDVDIYKFNASAGSEVSMSVNVTGGSLTSAVRIFDSAGNELASGIGSNAAPNSSAAILVPSSGQYFAAVSSSRNATFDPITGEGSTGLASNFAGTGTYTARLSGDSRLVNTPLDVVAADGLTSLREAINVANSILGQVRIDFDPAVFSTPQTINLTGGEFSLFDDTRIVGPGADLLTINAQGNSRIFNIDDGFDGNNQNIILQNMRLTGGHSNQGGAIRNREGLGLFNVAVEGNTSTGTGGGIFNDGVINASQSTIANNQANRGGAIFGGFRNGAELRFFRSTVSGNTTAVAGEGAITTTFGDTYFANSTITENVGGGFWGFGNSSYTETRIVSSIVSGNVGGDVNFPVGYQNTIFSDGFNLVGDGTGTSRFNQPGDIINTSPLLGPLTNGGGQTRTHALLFGSPAINAGDPNFSNPNIIGDQRDFERVADGRIDIGSFERQIGNGSLVVSTVSDLNDGDFSAGNLSLREAIPFANVYGTNEPISFFSPLFDSPQSITLNSQLPTITGNVIIEGPGADRLTLNAGTGFRHFEVNDGDGNSSVDVVISGLTMTGADVSSVADGEGRLGGAISNRENLTIVDSSLDSNSAFAGGAIGNRPGGVLNIIGSTLSGNSAVFAGGAIHASGSTTNVLNSTVSGNSADNRGGAIYQYGGSGLTDALSILHSTLQGNSGTAENTSIHSTGLGTKAIDLDNSIVAGVINNGNIFGSFNLLGSNDPGITGTNNLFTTDALLSPLADNGGPTPTHSLELGSPALNAGDPLLAGANVAKAGEASQTTLFNSNFLAKNALDGDLSTFTHTQANDSSPSWEVDLGAMQTLEQLVLHNRLDCCQDRLRDITVEVFDRDGNTVFTSGLLNPGNTLGGPTSITVDLGGVTGSKVVVSRTPDGTVNDGVLTLAEVEIITNVDQRGDGFARVGFGRVDIGAFELQDIVVSTTSDVSDGDFSPGELSLREAIELTNGMPGQGSIGFDSSFNTTQVIQLDGSLPTITQPLTIAGPGADLLSIDGGDGTDGVFNTQDGFRIFEFNDGNNGIVQESVLSGLTITGADPVGFSQGGAIYNFESLLIQDSDVVANAGRYGAGVRNRVELTVTGSSFRDNEAFRGGGIRNTGTLIVDDSEFVSNTVGNDGGAISSNGLFLDDSVEISNSLIHDNTSSFQGGGIWAQNATLTNVTITDNNAGNDGGGALNLGNSTFTNVEFNNNTADAGGAIHSVGQLAVDESTLSNNTAARGAAIYADDASSDVDINLTTITRNMVNTAGSGSIQKVDDTSSFVVNNTIVSDNSDTVGASNLVGNGFTGDFNLIGTGSTVAGVSNINSDLPGLVPSATGFTFSPSSASPAINAADPTISGGLDQIGNPRVVGGVADIGAVEANPAVVRALGVLPHGTTSESAYALRAEEVIFYQFELDTSIATVADSSLVIDTLGSSLVTNNDTELGLYDASGNLIASNDDFVGGSLLSRLSFGQGGTHGNLTAGTYFLAISGFNTTFGSSQFNATSSSSFTGDVIVNFDLDRGNAREQIAFVGARSDGQIELFRSDRTTTGTNLLKNIGGSQSSSPHELTVVGDTLFFAATGADGEIELFKTESNGLTRRVKDLAGPISSTPHELIDYNGTLHFVATGSDGQTELYRSNGINTGTVRVKNLSGSASANPDELTLFDNRLFFAAVSDTGERELYVSDGTGPGTTRLVNLYGQSTSSEPSDLTVVDDTLYFVATTPSGDRELHKTDGTAAGTGLVADLSGDSQPHELTEFSGDLYFAATENSQTELYKSDGTSAGTVLVADLSGTTSANPSELTVAAGRLFFTATTGDAQRELHATNALTTGLIVDLHGATNATPRGLTGFQSRLYFSAVGNDLERELYASDGTAAGTSRLKDLAGTASSAPHNLTAIGDALYFAATLATGETELFVSDGTNAGTGLVKNLSGSPAPQEIVAFEINLETPSTFAPTSGIVTQQRNTDKTNDEATKDKEGETSLRERIFATWA